MGECGTGFGGDEMGHKEMGWHAFREVNSGLVIYCN